MNLQSRHAVHCHRVFGLTIASDIELNDLQVADSCEHADVVVRRGPVDISIQSADRVILDVPNVGRYLISDGSQITVDARSNADPRNVRLFVLGSALGILLHQRKILALHAASIETEGATIAFTGQSGSGKSTLAAWFQDHSYSIAADDVCAMRLSPWGAQVLGPGPARMRLWRDAILSRGGDISTLKRSFVGPGALDKFDLPIGPGSRASSDLTLAAIYSLQWGAEVSINQVSGVEAFDALYANTYRGHYIGQVDRTDWHWNECVGIARSVPIFRFTRPRDQPAMDDANARLEEHVKSRANGKRVGA